METSISDGTSLLSLSAQLPAPPPRPPSVASNRSRASSRPSSAASQYPRPASSSGRRPSSSRPSSAASHHAARPHTSPGPTPPTPSLPGRSASPDTPPAMASPRGVSLSDELAQADAVDARIASTSQPASPASPLPSATARPSRPGSGARRGRRRSEAPPADSASSTSSSVPSPTTDGASSGSSAPPTADTQPLAGALQPESGPLAAAFAKRMASNGQAFTVTRGPQRYDEAESSKFRSIERLNERGHVDLVPFHRTTLRQWAIRKGGKFAKEVGRACVLLVRDGIWPMMADVAHIPASLRTASPSSATPSTPRHRRRSRSVSRKLSASFAERFKYTICTSFLLTSSLSISFYDSAPPLDADSASEGRSEDEADHAHLPTVLIPGGEGSRIAAPIDSVAVALGSPRRAPSLKPAGLVVRNAVVLAVLMSWPLASSNDAWFRASLALVALAWSSIVVLNLQQPAGASDNSSIAFVLTHSTRQPPSATPPPTPAEQDGDSNGPSLAEQQRIKQEAIACAQRLIRSAKAFDVAANRSISAIQEVEIVSRGYKITHPLPPITRIEASNGSLYRSPTKSRTTSWVAGGLLSRSSSNGAASGASWRSGGLSRSGSLKAPSSEAARTDNRRLMTLRKGLVQTFEQAEHCIRQALSSLEGRVDAEELALLRDMYVLDGTRALDGLVGETSLGDASAILEPQSAPAWSSNTITAGMMAAQSRKRASLLEGNATFSPARSASAAGPATTPTPTPTPDDAINGNPTHPKRLSLLSDGGLGISTDSAAPAAGPTSGTGSRRGSRILDGTSWQPPRSGSRLGYINSSSVDSPSTSGNPNDSAASKRLSYMSSASSAAGAVVIPGTSATATTNSSWTAGSRSGSRPPSVSFTHQTSDTGASPVPSGRRGSGAAPLGHYNTESTGLSRKRGSLMALGLGSPLPSQISTGTPVTNTQAFLAPSPQFGDLAHDPVSLMGLKSAFEGMHLLRRRLLCNLLALDFTLGAPEGGTLLQRAGSVDAKVAAHAAVEAYWDAVVSSMARLADRLDDLREELERSLAVEMGFGAPRASRFFGHGKAASAASAADIMHPSPPASRYSPDHTGIEDRAEAMGLALRSIQSKLRVCTEELRMRPPSALHGSEDGMGDTSRPPSVSSHAASNSISSAPPVDLHGVAPSEVAERVLESVREDLLALSAEWESALKIVRTERRRSPPQPQSPAACGPLDSPSEAEEDAARGVVKGSDGDDAPQLSSLDAAFEGFSKASAKMPWAATTSGDLSTGASNGRSDDTTLSDMLLAATSPDHLPPPGLEQVYEAIAGLASVLPDADANGTKLSREERIQAQRKARLQAQQAAMAAQEVLDKRGQIPDTAVVAELRGVLDVRKRQRDAQNGLDGAATAAQLGSPLNLDESVSASSGRFPSSKPPLLPPRRAPISAAARRSDESLATIRDAASRAASSKSLVDVPLVTEHQHDGLDAPPTSSEASRAAAAAAAQAAAAAVARRMQGGQV